MLPPDLKLISPKIARVLLRALNSERKRHHTITAAVKVTAAVSQRALDTIDVHVVM